MEEEIDIDDIFQNIESLNEAISEQQFRFQNWLEKKQMDGVKDKKILKEINLATGGLDEFKTLKDVEEWFENLGV